MKPEPLSRIHPKDCRCAVCRPALAELMEGLHDARRGAEVGAVFCAILTIIHFWPQVADALRAAFSN